MMMVNSVVSWSPCCVADDAKAAAYLAMEGSQAASLVEEACHFGGHPAEARACAHDDPVVLGKVVDAHDWGGLIELVVGCLGGLRR
jgi:hypothetical protein